MKNILIVNPNIKECGVYQYGKRFANICKKSKKLNFEYVEITSSEELIHFISENEPSVIIYNYVPTTMQWLNTSLLDYIRNFNIKQGTIIHHSNLHSGFDFYLHQNPYYENSENHYAILRPLFEYESNNSATENNNSIKIGTFGFGGKFKIIHEICKLVCKQLKYYNKRVELNLHITKAFYSEQEYNIEQIKNECISNITSNNIELNITNQFLSDEEVLDFLSLNDLNIFLYEYYDFYNGISSSIDYALSVKKPIAICKSNMFSHLWDVKPSIFVEDNTLLDIMDNGFKPLEEKYNSWTNEKFIKNIEIILQKY